MVDDATRQQAVEALEELDAAIACVIEAFQEVAKATQIFERAVRLDENLVELLAANEVPRMRSRQADLDRFNRARHRFRLAMVRVALSQGASVPDIARAGGYSPELAARLAKQAMTS